MLELHLQLSFRRKHLNGVISRLVGIEGKHQGLRAATLRVREGNPHKEPGVGEWPCR